MLSMCRSGWLRWVIPRPTIVLTCFMYSCSTQKWFSNSPQQPASGRSPLWLLLSGYMGLLYPPLFDPRGCGRRDSGYHTGHWTTLHELLMHLRVIIWEGVTLWHSCMSGSVHNSPCHKRTMWSAVARAVVECRTRNRVSPGSNPPLLPFRKLGIFVFSIVVPVDSAV